MTKKMTEKQAREFVEKMQLDIRSQLETTFEILKRKYGIIIKVKYLGDKGYASYDFKSWIKTLKKASDTACDKVLSQLDMI